MTRLNTVFNYPNKPVFDGFILQTIKLNPYLPVISCYKTDNIELRNFGHFGNQHPEVLSKKLILVDLVNTLVGHQYSKDVTNIENSVTNIHKSLTIVDNRL